MKTIYKGQEIDINRDCNQVADNVLFIAVTRLSDGFLVEEDVYYGSESVREMTAIIKRRIDKE